MTDLEAMWSALDADPPAPSGLLLRRLNVPSFDVYLTQERPSRLLGFRVQINDESGALWKELRSSKGLDIEVQTRLGRDATLMLTERDSRFHDIFAALVSNLVRGLELLGSQPADERPRSLDFLSSRITRWQACLRANRDGLSSERAAGLFGELSMMSALLDAGVDPIVTVDRWTGPLGAIQDFQFDRLAFEIKASRQTQPTNVRISSERQLDDSTHDRLVLVHYALDERSDGSGVTLPSQVAKIRAVLGQGHAGMVFDDRLIDYGYLDVHAPRYADRSYAVRSVDHFEVRDPMPRIVENDLPVGVGRVAYDLALSACEPCRLAAGEITALFAEIDA
jgi:hypothetical protein